jgi:hypothetical protein
MDQRQIERHLLHARLLITRSICPASAIQEIFADEIADEAQSPGEAQPSSQRNGVCARRRSTGGTIAPPPCNILIRAQSRVFGAVWIGAKLGSAVESIVHFMSGRSAAW